MVDAIVSFVIDRLGEQLIQQATSLVGVKDEVEDLRNELICIQSFLEDADSRQHEEGQRVVRNFVSQIRDAAYEIEDIIDTYILKVADEDVLHTAPKRRRFPDFLNFNSKRTNVNTITEEVKKVKTRIQNIGEKMKRYGIQSKDRRSFSPQDRFQQLRRSSPQDDAALKDIFGLEKKVEKLVAELVSDEVQCPSICIAGMGGIGKTTLATNLYNHERVKSHFECRAWVCVSKDFSIKDVFKILIRQVKSNLSKKELQEMTVFNEEYLEGKLLELLKDHTYLVVLDDVWELEAWESLKGAFPQQSKGEGRVIITSRNTKVAKESIIHQLQTLNEEDSWKLFVIKAFSNDDYTMIKSMEQLGKEMVKKCDGLPLAITVLAGLLRGKSPQEWFTVRDRIYQQPMLKEGAGKNNLEKIMSLSYNDLPYQLKACYLYIGLFPEDCKMETGQLILMWVAEGFIRCDEAVMEDVAREYLNDLIDRNMLQVIRQDYLGKVVSCGIHDLLREFCISRGKEENFLDYYPRASCSSSSSTMSSSIVPKSRRYAIYSGIGRYDFSNLSNSHIRTLLLFNRDHEYIRQQQLESITKIRLLRVLDLSKVNFQDRLADALGKLIHLKYLRLYWGYAKLPSSIESLPSLQTLDLSCNISCHWSDIGIGVLSKLTQLRHLLFDKDYWNGLDREEVVALPRIDTLTNLQTLRWVDALVWKQNEITNLINLRDLWICNINTSDVELILSSIAKLDRIQSLQLWSKIGENVAFPTLVPLSHCHHLQDLTLNGKIERLPEDLYSEFPPRLTELELRDSCLGLDAIAILEKLPNLMSLSLYNGSYVETKIVCSGKGFPQLRVLRTEFLDEIEEWEIKEGALPKLNHLHIVACIKLKKIPMGLRFVASLQVLELVGMSKEFWDRFNRGEDAHEIGHIPSINI